MNKEKSWKKSHIGDGGSAIISKDDGGSAMIDTGSVI